MTEVNATPAPSLRLPEAIATKADLVNVLRNLEEVLDTYRQNSIRGEEGVDFTARTDVSSNLAALVQENQLAVDVKTLTALETWLNQLKDRAPVVRFTFASDPTPEFLGRIVSWLRQASGQFVLVRFGIQPSIAAGCIMYTPAHHYDFSLRSKILKSGSIFIKYVSGDNAPTTPVVAKAQSQDEPKP